MKKIYLSLALLSVVFTATAQDLTSTAPTNKTAVVEELTGTSCPACPTGHAAVKTLLSGTADAIAIAYSPTNSGLTGPHNGGNDIRRAFADAFYTNPYYDNGGGRSMPSFHVNRKALSTTAGGRKVTTAAMPGHVPTVNGEASPVNMGLESLYDAGANELNIEVEMYFTQSVSNPLGLYVLITEDSVDANQSGSTQVPYYHFHTFRENVSTSQWGDAVTASTNMTDYASMTYSFDLTTAIDPLNISNSDIVAFLYDQTSGEIITGITVPAENGTTRTAPAGVTDLTRALGLNVYPNPATNEVHIAFDSKTVDAMTIQILGVDGRVVSTQEISNPTIGANKASIATTHLSNGNYFIKLTQGNRTAVTNLQIR